MRYWVGVEKSGLVKLPFIAISENDFAREPEDLRLIRIYWLGRALAMQKLNVLLFSIKRKDPRGFKLTYLGKDLSGPEIADFFEAAFQELNKSKQKEEL